MLIQPRRMRWAGSGLRRPDPPECILYFGLNHGLCRVALAQADQEQHRPHGPDRDTTRVTADALKVPGVAPVRKGNGCPIAHLRSHPTVIDEMSRRGAGRDASDLRDWLGGNVGLPIEERIPALRPYGKPLTALPVRCPLSNAAMQRVPEAERLLAFEVRYLRVLGRGGARQHLSDTAASLPSVISTGNGVVRTCSTSHLIQPSREFQRLYNPA